MKRANLYKGAYDEKGIIFHRVWAMPSAWTFTIHPIKTLLDDYVGDGKGWVDPFAGMNSPAEITNDHNPERKATYHMEALDFAKQLEGSYAGVLYDPPYSFTQISEHYRIMGIKPERSKTDMRAYEHVKSALCEKVKEGGYVISFGWNTNGFGRARGFEIVEILAVAHGGSKNDTLVTVERKIKSEPSQSPDHITH